MLKALALTRTQLDLVLPAAAAEDFQKALESGIGTLQYARVHMKLLEVVEGDFFNQYIKSGTHSSVPLISRGGIAEI